jgi:hypothetical protein
MVMRYLLPLAIAVLAAACDPTEPTPVWMPGSPPLAIWAETDQLWDAVDAGCARWRAAELRCRRVAAREDAQLEVAIGDAEGGSAITRYHYGSHGWEWSTVMEATTLADPENGAMVAAHEIGHTLGIIDHLPPGHLMSVSASSPTPTTADLEALADVWGESPWAE